ncbi:MAG TPA: hypothetical protein VIJ22_12680, partial [Polyangiaceae bacterium]
MLSRRAALVFGIADLLTAAVISLGVFVALPSRWWPVDSAAAALTALQVAAGAGLVAGTTWAERAARVASAVALALGLFLVTVLAVTASWLSGVYRPVGTGGAIILALVAIMV